MSATFPGDDWILMAAGKLGKRRDVLVSLSDPHHVVYVPTTQGYVLLLSPSQPDHFLEALRKVAPAT